MDVPSIILKLLADGIVYGEYYEALGALNELLRPIQYEVVRWPDGSCIVLKDNRSLCQPDARAKEIEEVFRRVACGMPVSGDVVDALIRERWIENVDGSLLLSKRSLVQHTDFILGLEGGYVICDVCGFLSAGGEVHEFCKSLLEKERGLNGGD
ncbi:hypothetical protein EHEL_091580 [Encephalitozoon hellem ATCC 50504]|uniref:Uncharacterized protein n=1 Tax=Encephalitozoon hellem TaxID=27973 RepID=A0A9Q9F8V5_ENCHE|nr:uncharacterized protein EHEL_091580 [Encephalitozoon hellem ATCC 50504]AFM99052.1 hypothetical protein EHEL_091580 [Encephalitozoon hellem ATCC 50504]UTX42457.1 hypothetical protein GPU96_01g01610 [Encephalitozoon hellem]|eukprot:XP_003888033.1 hypothetical protein EHEL_091580 [Encephalitozoon hellem ATCC 50504]